MYTRKVGHDETDTDSGDVAVCDMVHGVSLDECMCVRERREFLVSKSSRCVGQHHGSPAKTSSAALSVV